MNLKQALVKTVFQQCFGLKPDESVLIVTDEYKTKEAQLFFEAAKMISSKVELIKYQGLSENAQEPPKKIADKLQKADVALLVNKFSLSHTNTREEASKKGVRIASLPGINQEMIERTLTGNYQQIKNLSLKLAEILTKGKKIHLTTPSGTDLVLDISNRKAIADTGDLTEKGTFGNLPAGEAFLAPIEDAVNGVLVVDGCLAEIDLDRPLRVEVSHGRMTGLSGGKAVKKLRQAVLKAGVKAKIVAEFGIGTNPKAIVDSHVLEAEKVLGTCHIAFGNNIGFGGRNKVAFHTDGVVLSPTVKVDGQTILRKGKVIDL